MVAKPKARKTAGGDSLGGTNGKPKGATARKSAGASSSPHRAKPASGASQKPPTGYKGITAEVLQGKSALTVEQAKQRIGWTVVGENDKFLFKDMLGNRIALRNNSTNRPFRPGLANRYKNEILRRKWFLNGESIIFDWNNKCQSGQHRLVGFVLAAQDLERFPEKWEKYWKSEPVMECLIVHGVNPAQEVIDSIDRGQPRTLGDVFFRQQLFGDGSDTYSLGEGKEAITLPPCSDKILQKLANITSGAARLAWLRITDKKVSDAPHFPVSEAVDFVHDHSGLLECVAYIYKLEGGDGKVGNRITKAGGTSGISMGYAAGLMYLMMTSGTDPADWQEEGLSAVNFKMRAKARAFWDAFASGANLKEDSPVLLLRSMVGKIDAGSASGRDEIVALVIKAFNLFADGKGCKEKDLRIRKMFSEKQGKEVVSDDPRLGGLDSQGRNDKTEPVEETPDHEQEGIRVGKKWAEGDTCWVKSQDGDHWFGTIREVIKVEKGVAGGDMAIVEGSVDSQQWEEKVSSLSLKYPG